MVASTRVYFTGDWGQSRVRRSRIWAGTFWYILDKDDVTDVSTLFPLRVVHPDCAAGRVEESCMRLAVLADSLQILNCLVYDDLDKLTPLTVVNFSDVVFEVSIWVRTRRFSSSRAVA